jgi:HK97 family phage major capsid protein
MSTYDQQITRATDAADLIPEDTSKEIIQGAIAESAVLRLGRRLQNMPTSKTKMPVLNALPTGYFVAGDTGLKQTTKMAWANKYLNAEEIAVIVPIPEAVLDDSDYDIWGEVKPRLMEEFGRVIDAAVFYGTNKPSSWEDGIVTQCVAKSKSKTIGDDLYADLLEEGGVIAMVEDSGYIVTGHAGAISMRAKLRGVRDANGTPLFVRSMQESTRYELDGAPIYFPTNGSVDEDEALLVAGDFNQLVYSFRQDMTFKLLTEAVITDNQTPPQIIYNLAQQDMVALRAVMRIGWQIPNPINKLDATASRFPFAVLKKVAAG